MSRVSSFPRIVNAVKSFIENEFLQKSYIAVANDYSDMLSCRTTLYVFNVLAQHYEAVIVSSLEWLSAEERYLLTTNNYRLLYEITRQLLTDEIDGFGVVEHGLRENNEESFLLVRITRSTISTSLRRFFFGKRSKYIDGEAQSLEVSIDDLSTNQHVIFDDGSSVVRTLDGWAFSLVFSDESELDEFISLDHTAAH